MPDRHLITVVTLKHADGIAKDNFTNTFATIDDGSGSLSSLQSDVTNFYNWVDSGSGNYLATWIGNGVDRASNACQVATYDVTGLELNDPVTHRPPPHGSPVLDQQWTIDAAGGSSPSLPEECALVMTLRGIGGPYPVEGAGGTRPRERHTGRLFIGPFGSNAMASDDSSHRARPHPSLISHLGLTAANLAGALGSHGFTWALWSRTLGEFIDVGTVEVDNAWDTQRRRGPAATSRASTSV